MSQEKALEGKTEEGSAVHADTGVLELSPINPVIEQHLIDIKFKLEIVAGVVEFEGSERWSRIAQIMASIHLAEIEEKISQIRHIVDPHSHIKLAVSYRSSEPGENRKAFAEWAIRGIANVDSVLQNLVLSGELVKKDVFAHAAELSTQELECAFKEDRIFSVRHRIDYYVPAFFNDPMLRAKGIELVSQRLAPLRGESRLEFFCNPKQSLGGLTPIEAMLAGRVAEVLQAADGFTDLH